MTIIKFIFTTILITLAVSFAIAQDDPPPSNNFDETDAPQSRDKRLAEELGLTQEQRIQIRRLNQQRRPEMRAAQMQLNRSKDELDEMIYADNVDEKALQVKLRSVVEAQAEVSRIRMMSELAVRSVLTPEQLVKFRKLRNEIKQKQLQRRQQMQRRQQNRQQNRRMNPNRRDEIPQNRPQRPGNRPI